ncbi:MAG: heme-binding protein [Pseudolysinimonas sp.]
MSDLPVFTVADLKAQPALDVARFTNDDAVDLGLLTVALIRERGLSLCVKIVLHDDIVFQAKLANTGPGNDEWLEGKARVVARFAEPSLLVRRRHEEAGTPFEDRADVDHELLKAHGGSMPIRVGGDIVGTITTSGEPDVIDHDVTSEAVRRFLAR